MGTGDEKAGETLIEEKLGVQRGKQQAHSKEDVEIAAPDDVFSHSKAALYTPTDLVFLQSVLRSYLNRKAINAQLPELGRTFLTTSSSHPPPSTETSEDPESLLTPEAKATYPAFPGSLQASL